MSDKRVYYNLTHPQKRIWYIDKINFNSSLHNIGGCLRIHDNIRVDKMKEAIEIVIMKNDGMRLRFAEKDGQPVQYVHDFEKENIDFFDFSKRENPEEVHRKWAEDVFSKRFSLENSKLYYFAIYKKGEKQYGVLLNIHHIISDGWAISIIQKQICEVYSNLVNNLNVQLSEEYSYVDYIKDEFEYLSSDKYIINEDFWKSKFEDIPEELLYKSTNSVEGCRKSYDIDKKLSEDIKKFIENKRCSLNTFFISVLLIYMSRITNKSDIVIGTPIFNRINKKQKNTIGMFTSTVPCRFKLNSELNLQELINHVSKELRTCLINQKYPYDLLIKELGLGKKGFDSLFKISVNYYNSNYINSVNGMNVDVEEYYSGSQSYSLQLTINEWKDNITLNYDYKVSEYDSEEIHAMYCSMIHIVRQITTDKVLKLRDIKIVDEKEVDYKVNEFNFTNNYYPEKTVTQLFEELVLLTPGKVAIEFEEKILTYKELNEKANQLARFLNEKGITRGSIIGVMITHSIELVIGILAVMKTGAAYLPIEPAYPKERINYMLQDSKTSMLITNLGGNDLDTYETSVVNIYDLNLESYNKENLACINDGRDLAYIIYTSGSTGKPKGVMIEHKGLTNYLWWARKTYFKGNNEVMALYSSIAFDLTVTSLFTPLISGSKLIVYSNDENEFVLFRILEERKATIIKLTPAHLTLLKDMDNSKSIIKRFIVGGEDLKANLAKEIYKSFGENIEICNEYGPTETVVGCMIHKYDVRKDVRTSVPIGRPADNIQVYILDSQLNIVPQSIIGELYISGDGLAKGYLNREELTAEKFIDNPFVEGKKMYKTGDTARYLSNGLIEYIGRKDNQVKIRGYRIELGEIEKYLLDNKFVKEAVVTINHASDSKLLNAYIVARESIEESELKDWLIQFLPNYMIPNKFVFLDHIPLTINGKVDYNQLPSPKMTNDIHIQYETKEEKELVKVMEEVLGVKNISMNDNYFQLGGDSIKAIQISSRLKEAGLDVKIKDILGYDSIREIACSINSIKNKEIADQEICIGNIPNTPIIEWFFEQKLYNNNLYNQYVFLEFNKSINKDHVAKAFKKLIEHHDTLRINFNSITNILFYNNEHLHKQNLIEFHDLSKYSSDEQHVIIRNITSKIESNIDIGKSLLFNCLMFDLGKGRQAILFNAHHIIIDGVSWRILINDFLSLLNQIENEKEMSLPMKTHSFREWAELLGRYKNNDFQEERTYWDSILGTNFEYPQDFSQGEDLTKTSSIVTVDTDEDFLATLVKASYEIYNLDLNEVLIIALVLSINNVIKSEDIVIELERHGRERIDDYIDISRTVGWFTSLYPVHFKIDNSSLDHNIKLIKEQIRSIPNNGFNYGVIRYLNRELEGDSTKNIRFNYLGDFDNLANSKVLKIDNLEFRLNSDMNNSLTALIDITAMIINRRLKISAEFSKNKFKNETVEKLIDKYLETLQLVLECCINKPNKDFTPSDFDAVDISQDDLDALFD